MARIFFTLVLIFSFCYLDAQSYAVGIKGGLTVGFQQWDNFSQRDPLYRYHGVVSIETADEEEPFSIFAQLGYHVKGSAIRTNPTTVRNSAGTLFDIPARETPFEFNNLSLTLGGKQKFDLGNGSRYYYLLGVRGDYTLNTNLGDYQIEDTGNGFFFFNASYPVDEFVQKWNYGVTVGGGLEFDISEFVGTTLEFTVNPDFSRQYLSPEIQNVIVPWSPNNTTIRERQIRNITIEVSLGFRFLRKIEYID